jgi:hypothetical protein
MRERLVYVSRAALGIGAREAYDIIRVSHNRNSRYGLTGALILFDGHFLQVLEGDAIRLRERYARIATDPRHTDVVLRQCAAVRHLSFESDWMAMRHDDEITHATRERYGYSPGFPADRFDGDRLVAFALACCRAHVDGQQSAV